MTKRVPLIEPDPPRNKGGRPFGSMSKIAKAAREKAIATGELPHEFLLRIVRGEAIYRDHVHPRTKLVTKIAEIYGFTERIDAAKAAAPYYAPKISTVEVIHGVSDDELDAIIARAASEAGVSISTGGEGTEGEDTEDGAPRTRVRLT